MGIRRRILGPKRKVAIPASASAVPQPILSDEAKEDAVGLRYEIGRLRRQLLQSKLS